MRDPATVCSSCTVDPAGDGGDDSESLGRTAIPEEGSPSGNSLPPSGTLLAVQGGVEQAVPTPGSIANVSEGLREEVPIVLLIPTHRDHPFREGFDR